MDKSGLQSQFLTIGKVQKHTYILSFCFYLNGERWVLSLHKNIDKERRYRQVYAEILHILIKSMSKLKTWLLSCGNHISHVYIWLLWSLLNSANTNISMVTENSTGQLWVRQRISVLLMCKLRSPGVKLYVNISEPVFPISKLPSIKIHDSFEFFYSLPITTLQVSVAKYSVYLFYFSNLSKCLHSETFGLLE